ncbi:hypothetical protein PAHAL_1G238600 [Panicum hallii]|uniref:FBD domain-containing protein n=1 Tax=Panicum hallii TaxID=206008 RepID=A0A2S3GNQ8_9POAL|nr:hypothetical protein PAHAL_1G238600 [Panicum hallii]
MPRRRGRGRVFRCRARRRMSWNPSLRSSSTPSSPAFPSATPSAPQPSPAPGAAAGSPSPPSSSNGTRARTPAPSPASSGATHTPSASSATQPSGRRRSATPTAGSASWSSRGSKPSSLISTDHMEVEDDNILEGLSCPFNDLKRLTLDTSLSLLSSVLSVFCLLRNAPKLEDLYIEVNDVYSERDEVEIDFLNAQWTGDLLSKLIRADVVDTMCTLSEMNFIKLYCPRQDGLKNSMSVLLKTVQNPMKRLQSW